MSARKQPKPSNIVEYKRDTDPRQGLTAKQARFAEFYVLLGSKTEAAIKAGYSAKSATWQVRELTAHHLVSTYIRYLLSIQQDDMMASIAEAKRMLSRALRGEIKEQVVVMETSTTTKRDKKGHQVKVTKTKPKLMEKRISIRDSLRSAELLYGVMAEVAPDLMAAEQKNQTDEALLKALKQHQVTAMPDTKNVKYEEDRDDGTVPTVRPTA